MRRMVLSVIVLAFTFVFASAGTHSAFADKRVALVVGNSAYQHAPTLANPVNDAKAIAAMFQQTGFEVVVAQYDVGVAEFKRALGQFEQAAADSDIAVVYYSGHGIGILDTNYLVPVDATLASDRDAEAEAISLDRLVESIDGAKRLRVLILDACRDDPFALSMKKELTVATRNLTLTHGLAMVEPASVGTLIAYSAKAGSVAEEGDADHSPFAQALLNNLSVPGLDIRLAFGRLREEVLRKTGNWQEPFVYGSLIGANIALVPAPTQPVAVASLDGEASDYSLVEKIGTKGAWQVFLDQHPSGPHADLARQQLAKLSSTDSAAAAPTASTAQPAVAPLEAAKPPAPPASSAEKPVNARDDSRSHRHVAEQRASPSMRPPKLKEQASASASSIGVGF